MAKLTEQQFNKLVDRISENLKDNYREKLTEAEGGDGGNEAKLARLEQEYQNINQAMQKAKEEHAKLRTRASAEKVLQLTKASREKYIQIVSATQAISNQDIAPSISSGDFDMTQAYPKEKLIGLQSIEARYSRELKRIHDLEITLQGLMDDAARRTKDFTLRLNPARQRDLDQMKQQIHSAVIRLGVSMRENGISAQKIEGFPGWESVSPESQKSIIQAAEPAKARPTSSTKPKASKQSKASQDAEVQAEPVVPDESLPKEGSKKPMTPEEKAQARKRRQGAPILKRSKKSADADQNITPRRKPGTSKKAQDEKALKDFTDEGRRRRAADETDDVSKLFRQ